MFCHCRGNHGGASAFLFLFFCRFAHLLQRIVLSNGEQITFDIESHPHENIYEVRKHACSIFSSFLFLRFRNVERR